MEFKGTKSAWQLYTPPHPIVPFKAFIVDADKRTTIAAVHDRTRVVTSENKTEAAEETKANAKLIAAAPEMLGVLNYLQSEIQKMPAFRKMDVIKQNELIHRINAAINKATK